LFGFASEEIGLALKVGRVVTLPAGELASVEVEGFIGHALDEGAVVGNEEQGDVGLAEKLFEPADAGDVEVIGRLVEEQDVWLGDEGAGEQGAAFVAAGESGKVLIGVEFDALEDVFDLVLDGPAVGLVEFVLQLVQAVDDFFVVGMFAEFVE